MEAEASPAEMTPLCLTTQSLSDVQTHAELPSSTTLGRPQSLAASPEGRSEIRRRSQGGPEYIRSKMKVRKRAVTERAKYCWWLSGEHFKNFFSILFVDMNKYIKYKYIDIFQTEKICLPLFLVPKMNVMNVKQ